MRTFLLSRSALLLVMMATNTLASEHEQPVVRPVLLSEHPDDDTHRIYVKGAIVTTLQFEKPVDAGRTRMLGWEGRLEPLAVVRNKVLLEPLHDLNEDEAIPLLVTLVDGTEVSFLLRPPRPQELARTDQQVDVFRNLDSYSAMRSALQSTLQKNDLLTQENERYRKEETSADHALAALLASGAIAQTPFKIADQFSGKDSTADVEMKVFRGRGKAAVTLRIKNLDSMRPWSMMSARLSTKASSQEREFAVRATFRELAPGTSGVLALVVDGDAFLDGGKWTNLFLEIYRQDGQRQAIVELDPGLAGH